MGRRCDLSSLTGNPFHSNLYTALCPMLYTTQIFIDIDLNGKICNKGHSVVQNALLHIQHSYTQPAWNHLDTVVVLFLHSMDHLKHNVLRRKGRKTVQHQGGRPPMGYHGDET